MTFNAYKRSEIKDLSISWTLLFSLFCFIISTECEDNNNKRAYSDSSIDAYFSERTCWWNEVCKREFQVRFRCRCPRWSFCRSPGRYFDAYCSITRTGYIWLQHSVDPDDQNEPLQKCFRIVQNSMYVYIYIYTHFFLLFRIGFNQCSPSFLNNPLCISFNFNV